MKRVLLLFGLSLPLFVGAQAQINAVKVEKQAKFRADYVSMPQTSAENNVSRVSLWSSDFSDSTRWVKGNAVGTQGAWSFGSAPASTFTQYLGAVTHLTAPYAYYNSVKFYLADPNGIPAQNAWITTKDSIDVSSVNFIRVSFKQLYRPFNTDAVFIEVINTETGAITSKELNTEVPTNISQNVDQFADFDVTAADSILVRFRFTGDAGQGGYGWIVDGVDISESPAIDVKLESPYTGLYTKYPLGQEVRDIDLSVAVSNRGSVAQNISLTALNGATTVSTVAGASYAAFLKDTVEFGDFFTPAAGLGVKTINFEAAYTTPGTETIAPVTSSFEVTPNIFSKDRNIYYAGQDYGGFTVGGDPITSVASAFVLTEAAKVTSVSVVLGDNTTAGSAFKATLYGLSTDQTSLEYITESDLVDVTASQINTTSSTSPKVVKVGFNNTAIEVQPGEYWVSIDNEGGDIGLAFDPFTIDPTLDGVNPSLLFLINNAAEWSGLVDPNIPYIRLNVNEAGVSVDENVVSSSVAVFPNPTSDFVNITMKDLSGMATFKMYNMNGQQVLNENVNVTSDSFVKTIDVSSFAAGVYTINIVSNKGVSTKKVSIN